MDDRERDLIRVLESVGKRVVKIRSGCAYRIESFDAATDRVKLIPLHKGGRTTKKWFRHLFLDYRIDEPEQAP